MILSVISFIAFFFGADILATFLVSLTGLNPITGLIIICPTMGFLFHHLRNWISLRSGIKPVKSAIGMMIWFSLWIILKLIIPSTMN